MLAVIGSKERRAQASALPRWRALAGERWTCVLVDLDALGGGFDLRLGVDPRQGSLLGLRGPWPRATARSASCSSAGWP